MNVQRSFLATALAAAGLLPCAPAAGQPASTGPGAMRCTVVIGRLSSQDAAERMPVLSWVQGYLAGIAATRPAAVDAAPASVPEYDALQPRILTLCRAHPTADLYHVAADYSASPEPGRGLRP